jgi:protein-disulfide isomerase
MTRSTLVAGTAAVALLAFGGAAWVASSSDPAPEAAVLAPGAAAAEPAEAISTATTETATPDTAMADTAMTDTAMTEAAPASEPAAAAAPADDPLVRPYSPVLGPADAPVTIVEFFDPSCEACRAFHPVLQGIREQFPNEVRIVMRYTPFHEGSDEAVRILELARAQGVFEPVLDALLERQPEWAVDGAPETDRAWAIAGEAGLDVEAARARRMLPGIVTVLNQDMADVEALGIQQTPTFFVNGEPLAEFGAEELVEAVRAEVEAAG